MNWTVEFLNEAVLDEFKDLPLDLQAGIMRVVSLIQAHGLEKIGMPYVRHLTGKLWEIRGKGKNGISRSIYVTSSGRRIVVLRSFVKKTEKTPKSEIQIALKRLEDLK